MANNIFSKQEFNFQPEILLTIMVFIFLQEVDDGDADASEMFAWEAIGWLAILTVWVSVLSGYLVDAIQVNFTPNRS